jgi:hypothetical protein
VLSAKNLVSKECQLFRTRSGDSPTGGGDQEDHGLRPAWAKSETLRQ